MFFLFCLFVCFCCCCFLFPLSFFFIPSFLVEGVEGAGAPSLHFLSASLQLMGTTFMLCLCCTPKCQFLSEGSFYVHLVPRFSFLVPWALQLRPEHLAVWLGGVHSWVLQRVSSWQVSTPRALRRPPTETHARCLAGKGACRLVLQLQPEGQASLRDPRLRETLLASPAAGPTAAGSLYTCLEPHFILFLVSRLKT